MATKREKTPGACDPAPEEELVERGTETDLLPEAFTSAAGRRRMIREALGAITLALLTKAQEGSATHLKLLMDLGAYEKGTLAAKRRRRTERSLEEVLVEQWRRDEEEQRAEAQQAGEQTGLTEKHKGGVDGG